MSLGTSYVLGAAGVNYPRFAAACVGLLPSAAFEVYVGYAGKHLAGAAVRSARAVALHDAVLVAGLATAIAVMVVISRMARRAVEAAARLTPESSAKRLPNHAGG